MPQVPNEFKDLTPRQHARKFVSHIGGLMIPLIELETLTDLLPSSIGLTQNEKDEILARTAI